MVPTLNFSTQEAEAVADNSLSSRPAWSVELVLEPPELGWRNRLQKIQNNDGDDDNNNNNNNNTTNHKRI